MPKVTECPHCGGTSGVAFTYSARIPAIAYFDGKREDSDMTEVVTPKTGNCFDCGKRIKLSLILVGD